MKNLDYKQQKNWKAYRLICDIYNTVPIETKFLDYYMKDVLVKLKKVIKDVNLNEEEMKLVDDYYSNNIKRDYKINTIINKIRQSKSLSLLKEDKKTYDSYTKDGTPLYVDGVGVSITDKECQFYIDELYQIFNDVDFIKVDINSSKSDIKFFLNQVTNYVIDNDIGHDKYNYHHIGFIHTYFIHKGWTNIYKSMEIFLRTYYFDADITSWYLNYNIRRKNKESIKYKVLFNNNSLYQYEDRYKEDLFIRLKLSKRYYKEYKSKVINEFRLLKQDYEEEYGYLLPDDVFFDDLF